MKNLKFILVLAISIMAISCGNDDDGAPAGPTLTPALLEGTYELTFYESTDVIEEVLMAATVTTTITEVADTFGSSNITFNANGTFTENYQYRITETTTFESNEPTVETFIETINNSGTYTVNDANQTITIDGDVIEVTQFSNGQLRLMYDDIEVEGNETSTFNEESRFTRQ